MAHPAFQLKTAKDGQTYFTLTAGNGEVIGKSEMYSSKAAAENGVNNYVLVSSSGANPNSRLFYARMKGELDEAVKKLSFKKISIIKPSVLGGPRKETRIGEKIGIVMADFLGAIVPPLKKYRTIHAGIVADAMRNAVLDGDEGVFNYELEEVFNLAKK